MDALSCEGEAACCDAPERCQSLPLPTPHASCEERATSFTQ